MGKNPEQSGETGRQDQRLLDAAYACLTAGMRSHVLSLEEEYAKAHQAKEGCGCRQCRLRARRATLQLGEAIEEEKAWGYDIVEERARLTRGASGR